MKNKNLYIMKQPDLGKKILELRKSKGLTQEELVEKCNINVRTIQRIEAGDVTPRSFTIKTILEVLGVESDTFFGEFIDEEAKMKFSTKEVNVLRQSWIAAIFFTIFSAVSMFAEFTILFDYEYSFEEIFIRTILGFLSLAALLFFLKGYKMLGEKSENKTLVYATYIYFLFEVFMIFITIVLTVYDFSNGIVEATSGVLLILLLGVAEIILGLGIMKLKKHYGSFAHALGIIKIVYGAILVTVILSPIAILLAIPILITEIVFLYKVTQKLSN